PLPPRSTLFPYTTLFRSNSEFHTWLLGVREDGRELRSQILRALTERLRAIPHEALPFARELVRVDPYDETAWALLIATQSRRKEDRKSTRLNSSHVEISY